MLNVKKMCAFVKLKIKFIKSFFLILKMGKCLKNYFNSIIVKNTFCSKNQKEKTSNQMHPRSLKMN